MADEQNHPIAVNKLAITAQLQNRPHQPLLHHYTRRRGLIGLCESKKIWASNALYLNDAQELETAERAVTELLTGHDYAPDSLEARLFQEARNSIRAVRPQVDVFVFSLSEQDDLLSQWRAYARGGDGYTIGFDVGGLTNLASDSDGYLARCHYETADHKRLLQIVIDDSLERLHRAVEGGRSDTDARGEALAVFVGGFHLAAPMIKDPCFEEEREWRLVFPFFNVWDKEVCFRNESTVLIPYLPVSIRDRAGIISRVMIGPTPHRDLETRAVSGLLTKAGFPAATVEASVIPYREW